MKEENPNGFEWKMNLINRKKGPYPAYSKNKAWPIETLDYS